MLVISFSLLLATGLIHAATLGVRFGDADGLTPQQRQEAWAQILVVEAIDALIVLATYLVLRRQPQVKLTERRRLWVWPASMPLLGVMLAVNVGYHWVLRYLIGNLSLEEELLETPSWIIFFGVCIQPAIVEEAYCRGIALGILRRITGVHSAVWISAMMFGLMHVSVALSIPYLILFGAFVGYMRVASGTIWLPILLHFLHNLAVVLSEWN